MIADINLLPDKISKLMIALHPNFWSGDILINIPKAVLAINKVSTVLTYVYE